MLFHGAEALHVDVQTLEFVAHVLIENPDHGEHACVIDSTVHLIKLSLRKIIVEGKCTIFGANIGSLFLMPLRLLLRLRGEVGKLFLQLCIKLLMAQYLGEVISVVRNAHFSSIRVSRAHIMKQLNASLGQDLLKS